jgi:branched-subunit amino acid transport protein
MNEGGLWWVIAGGMIATYAGRLSFIGLIPPERLPGWLRKALRFVPPAVLSALVAPELLRPAGPLDISLGNTRLLAGLVASVVAWRLRNTWATLAAGLLAYVILSGR